MLKGQDIVIIGAGIGGLAAAVALAQRGAAVRILEQAPGLSEVGAGIQISPNGFAVLAALGLGDKARAVAMRSEAVTLRDYRRGAPVLRLDLARHAPDQTFLLFHRADLITLLADAARAIGVRIEPGRTLAGLAPDPDGNGVRLALADGTGLTAPICIGADGLHSQVRAHLNGAQDPFFTGQVAWRAVVPEVAAHRPAGGATGGVVDVFMGPGRHLVTYPLRGGRLRNIVAVREQDHWVGESWSRAGDPDDLRQAFGEFSPDVRDLLGAVETVHEWGLFRHPVASRWHDDTSALLGDAAHPTLPFMAQGANLALEDAWVLAACLAAEVPARAFAQYQARRQTRVARAIKAANANARNYHLRQPLVRGAAHTALRLGGAIAPKAPLRRFDWLYRHDVTRKDPAGAGAGRGQGAKG